MVRPWVLIGFIAQLALLAALARLVPLTVSGWVFGLGFAVVVNLLLALALGDTSLGPANRVTLTRAILVGGVAALVASGTVPAEVLVGITVPALILDAVDGRVARLTHSVSTIGARFDGEIDAFLILVLSIQVSRTLGLWVLGIGAMRYALWVAEWIWPWLREPVPPRYWRKVVAAIQGIALTIAMAQVLPTVANVVLVAGALLLLCESFGDYVIWLWRHHLPAERRKEPVPE